MAATEKQVLVVEDSASNRQLLADLLEKVCVCTVVTAETGEDGVDLAARHVPDLILMDVGLPGMDGVEAARIIKADPKTAHVPTLALTGYASVDDEKSLMAAGFDGFLPKPFDVPLLLDRVSAYLERRI